MTERGGDRLSPDVTSLGRRLAPVLGAGWWVGVEYALVDDCACRWERWGKPLAGTSGADAVLGALATCLHARPHDCLRLVAEHWGMRARVILPVREY